MGSVQYLPENSATSGDISCIDNQRQWFAPNLHNLRPLIKPPGLQLRILYGFGRRLRYGHRLPRQTGLIHIDLPLDQHTITWYLPLRLENIPRDQLRRLHLHHLPIPDHLHHCLMLRELLYLQVARPQQKVIYHRSQQRHSDENHPKGDKILQDVNGARYVLEDEEDTEHLLREVAQ